MLYLLVSSTVIVLISYPQQQFWITALLFLSTQAGCILPIVMFHFFIMMWFISRGYCYLNARLQQLYELAQREQSANVCRQLELVMCMHWRLAQMLKRLTSIFSFQALVVRFIFFTSHVMMGFSGFVYTFEKITPPAMVAFGGCTYIFMASDLYCFDTLCERTMRGYNESLHILRLFNDLPTKSKRLQKTCEKWALQLCSFKMEFNLCGLFNLDRSRWFQTIAAGIPYSLVLIQFHIFLLNQRVDAETW